MPHMLRLYVTWIDRLSHWVGLVAMYLIFVMIGILLLDAITRNVIDIPLHWCIEAAQFTLAAYYFMGGAWSLKSDQHVRMDLLYDRLPQRMRDWVEFVTLFCLIFYLGVLLTGSISSLEYAIQTNETRFSMWNPSMIPIKALMVGCVVLMILQAAGQVLKAGAKLRGLDLNAEAA